MKKKNYPEVDDVGLLVGLLNFLQLIYDFKAYSNNNGEPEEKTCLCE